MLGLINGENFKIRKGNMSRIMVFVYLFFEIIYLFQSYNTFFGIDISEMADDETIKVFSAVLGDLIHYGNIVKGSIILFGIFTLSGLLSAMFIVPIFTSIFVSDEFQTRGIHQSVSKGVSRYKIVLSKYLSICEFITIMDVCAIVIGFVITIITFGQGNISIFVTQLIRFGMKLLLMNYAFVAIGLFFSFTIKNSAAAMVINFIIIICLFGQLSTGLFSTNIMMPTISYIIIAMIALFGSNIIFVKSDI